MVFHGRVRRFFTVFRSFPPVALKVIQQGLERRLGLPRVLRLFLGCTFAL